MTRLFYVHAAGLSILVFNTAARVTIQIPPYTPSDASDPIPKDFQSLSIELAYWPDFASNLTSPNDFTKNLMHNLEEYTGHAPLLRIGGGTQDKTTFNPRQKEAIQMFYEKAGSDQPSSAVIGPAFFESFHTLSPKTEYIHGFNYNYNKSDALSRVDEVAQQAFESIGNNLLYAELGNEADLAPGRTRPINFTSEEFVEDWTAKEQVLSRAYHKIHHGTRNLQLIGPSFAWEDWVLGSVEPYGVIKEGYGQERGTNIGEISMHNYMNSHSLQRLDSNNGSLQFLLMNHSSIVHSVAPHLRLRANLSDISAPYTFGECNSISGQWADFALWTASQNIKRVSFHQGYKYRYGAWDSNTRDGLVSATRPPYYGMVLASKAIGKERKVSILPLDLKDQGAIPQKTLLLGVPRLPMRFPEGSL